MKDSHLSLDERIQRALDRIKDGAGNMRIPVEATDPDMVLTDCREEIERLRAELADYKETGE